MSNTTLSVKILDTIESIDELGNVLDDLGNIATSSGVLAPSLKKYWLLSFVRAYGASRKLAITVVFCDNLPKLIMPLQHKVDGCLEFLCDETADYNDFLYSKFDIEVLSFALQYWNSKGIRKICLDRLPSDSKTIEMLRVITSKMNWAYRIEKCDSLPVVITQPDKGIYNWCGVKSHAIKRYIRKQKALMRIADVKITFVETASQLMELFPRIKQIHVSRWKLKGIKSKYLDPRRESFILDICQEAINDKTLFLPIMKINGILASFIIGFVSGDTVFDWNTSFSTDYSKWSPGSLLLLHVLSNSKELGFSKYNLMKGLESHKFIWTNNIEENLSFVVEMR